MSPGDLQKIEAVPIGMLRSMMKGEACQRTGSAVSVAGHWISKPNEEVLKYWRFPPLKVELKVRRLKWFQAMVRNPEGHAQVIAALFGDLEIEQADPNFQPTLKEGMLPMHILFLVDVSLLA